jgi:HEAT repeat protein
MKVMYTQAVEAERNHGFQVMMKMEEEFLTGKEDYFIRVLQEESSLVLRVHAVTILAELGGEKAVSVLSDILLNDPDPLIRHEAAFSLGQIGLSSGNKALSRAALTDGDPIVRHESAAALGSIGSQESLKVLKRVLEDREEIVRNSAIASIFNIDFLNEYGIRSRARERAPRP